MHKVKSLIVVFFLCIVALGCSAADKAIADSPMVKIDGDAFSQKDVRDWWHNWREEGMEVPETLDTYIDWLLFAREAERMVLFDDPQYQHELNVYLKVISLVSLKNEEVDGKIDYSEEKLWEYYQKFFSPIWQFNILIFKDQESAKKTRDDLVAGKMTLADLVQLAGEHADQEKTQKPHGGETIDVAELKKLSDKGADLLGIQEKVSKRPYNIDKIWYEAIKGLDKGAFSDPFSWQEGYVVLNLLDTVKGNKEDFTTANSVVKNRYRKYQEAVLTNKLVDQLKKKYEVVVDEERVANLDPKAPIDQFSDAPVITFSNMKVTEKQLMEKVRQDIEFNKKYGFQQEELNALVKRILDGVVSQTLITMESLDRHYERTSPNLELFEFYKRNKLVKKLEEQIKSQVQEATDQEITSFYTENLSEFTSPQIYQMALIEGSEEELKKIWLEVVVNKKDVMMVTEERLGHKPEVRKFPVNHLAAEVSERASALANGDMSQVFPLGEGFAMVYMVESIPPRAAKLEEIRPMIAKKINWDRFSAAREEYLNALREKAEITVNDTAWKKMRQELVKENEKK